MCPRERVEGRVKVARMEPTGCSGGADRAMAQGGLEVGAAWAGDVRLGVVGES